MEAPTVPLDFDLWTQNVTLILPDGSNFNFTVENFNEMRLYTGRLAISYGTQIGASILLLLVLLLLTRAEKRKSSIFLVNALCLLVNAIRCVLLSCYVTSTWANPYSQMVGNYSRVTNKDKVTVVAANIFTILVTVLVMVSLSLQVWVVCITTMPVQRFIIMGATTLVACVATGYKVAFVILNIKQTLRGQEVGPYRYVVSTSYITQAVSIWLFSCVFTYKLGHAIIQRRKLKMPQFGPMQIVFIMGCQTMLVPGKIFPPALYRYSANTSQPSSHASNSATTSPSSASLSSPSSASSSRCPPSGPASSTKQPSPLVDQTRTTDSSKASSIDRYPTRPPAATEAIPQWRRVGN